MIDELIENCLPMIRGLKKGRYAVTIGGSIGKGLSHSKSDVDFRLYADDFIDDMWGKGYEEAKKYIAYWAERGIIIDGVWMRKIAEIDEPLNKWLAGDTEPEMLEWTVWGYYLPTDIYNQKIIEDPFGIAEDWKKRMEPYPEALKSALINKHINRLKYWKNDYHYKNKADRKDIVFLASLSASLVHDMMQVLCALNGVYFPGDGHNLSVAGNFKFKPDEFEKRIESVLYPESPDKLLSQYNAIIDLINDIEKTVNFSEIQDKIKL